MSEGWDLNKQIRKLRKKSGLTQENLAKHIGVSTLTVQRWEWGQRSPRMEEVARIAAALNVTESELLNGPEAKEFEVKIVMGVKNLTGLAGMEVADNSFIFGVQDDKPQIHLAGKIMIGTPEEREAAKALLLQKFERACWMFDHQDD